MGYYVEWMNVSITVPAEKKESCLKAINEIMKPEVVKKHGTGGGWTSGKQTEWWYAWVENPPKNRYTNLKKAFEGWGFSVSERKNGDLEVDCIENEKLGQEDFFLKTIAPYVDPESVVEARGEDGFMWLWTFKKGKLVEKTGKVRYS